MRTLINLLSATSLIVMQLVAVAPAAADPGDRGGRQTPQASRQAPQRSAPQSRQAPMARPAQPTRQAPTARPAMPSHQAQTARPQPSMSNNRPGDRSTNSGSFNRPTNTVRPDGNNNDRPGTNNNRPGSNNDRPGMGNNRPGGNNNININNNHNTNINISGNNRYPVYRPPGGGYYRPPNGGYYGPPRPPYGGWHGGYYPPPRYYYDDGPSVGGVLFGVAVTTSLLAMLSMASQPTQTVIIQGQAPPALPPYVPPQNTTGAPAVINVDINSMSSDARPSASVCLTEAARQIGATGGSEIRVDQIVEVEKGNGGYRFRLTLIGVYPDATRKIPMYCRSTPEKIIELTFG